MESRGNLKAIHIVLAAIISLLLVCAIILVVWGVSTNFNGRDNNENDVKTSGFVKQTNDGGYNRKLDAQTCVYDGPGYNYNMIGTVGETGIYTIAQSEYDAYGNCWGRLEIGKGWVCIENTSDEVEPIIPTPEQDTSYTINLSSSKGIYSGPGYGYTYIQSVGKTGVYTIVQQQYDGSGNLWGKLKSGVGWVCLRGSYKPKKSTAPVNTSYTVNLSGSTPIYKGPGYGYGSSQTVGKTGIYRIVQHQYDSSGTLWGKLKSGVGWVALG